MTEENRLKYHSMMLYMTEYNEPRMLLQDYTCKCPQLFLILAPGKKGASKGKGKGIRKHLIPRPQQPAPHPIPCPPRLPPPQQAPRVKLTPDALGTHDEIMESIDHMYRGR